MKLWTWWWVTGQKTKEKKQMYIYKSPDATAEPSGAFCNPANSSEMNDNYFF